MQSLPVISTLDAMEEKETTDFDTSKLLPYLTERLPDFDAKALKIRRFSSGFSNAPYMLDCGTKKYVLRFNNVEFGQKHISRLGPQQQYELIRKLSEHSQIPVAKMYLFCSDESIIGNSFFVQQFVEGRVFTFCGWHLPTIDKKDRAEIWYELCRVMSLIHSVDVHKLDISSIIAKQVIWDPSHFFNAFAKSLNTAANSESIQKQCDYVPKFNELMKGLMKSYDGNVDIDHSLRTLIHGDIHFENVIFHPTENRIIAVVDWEFCTVGHPLMDLAYVCHMTFEAFETESIKSLGLPADMWKGCKKSTAHELAQLGLPTEIEFISRYLECLSPLVSAKMMDRVVSCLEQQSNWLLLVSLHFLRMFGLTFVISEEQMADDPSREKSRMEEVIDINEHMPQMLDSLAEKGENVYSEKLLGKADFVNIVAMAPFQKGGTSLGAGKHGLMSTIDLLLDLLNTYLEHEA